MNLAVITLVIFHMHFTRSFTNLIVASLNWKELRPTGIEDFRHKSRRVYGSGIKPTNSNHLKPFRELNRDQTVTKGKRRPFDHHVC
jgi:hypothetical protein